MLNNLEVSFPNHSLLDEVLFKKADLYIAQEEYEKALNNLDMICTQYHYDILYDDALFYQAQIYEQVLENKEQAQKKYEELLLKNANSIFINEAREKYRLLRNSGFLNIK